MEGGGVERNRNEDAKVERDGRSIMLFVKVFTAAADVTEVEKEGEQRERVFGRSLDGRRLEEPAIMTSSTLREATTVVGRFIGAEVTREIAFLEREDVCAIIFCLCDVEHDAATCAHKT